MFTINPSLELRETSSPDGDGHQEWTASWCDPDTNEPLSRTVTPVELLALKILAEDMDLETAAAEGGKTVSALHQMLLAAANSGIVLPPRSGVRRTDAQVPATGEFPSHLRDAKVFTLQWHLTNRCDLNCKHCYDRTDRAPFTLEQSVAVLDDLARFCMGRNVRGHVSFSGGNPLLHTDFLELYRHAASLGFEASILGNPTSRAILEKIQAVQPLDFFQTSLEGLREHNDTIRGAGHFDRVMSFLEILKSMGISASIMLTLTRDNMDQVIPLGERLEGLADHFTFNRLSPVGEGASLALPEPDDYRRFLSEYVEAAGRLTVLGYKDNLINVELHGRGEELFNGCTGFGCGAAFNFVALLPDGEVHACRKYPSLIGNMRTETLEDIYAGDDAARYRTRPAGCRECALVASCGGCPAITSGCGGDAQRDVDPFCRCPV